jgi:hypothetical protein
MDRLRRILGAVGLLLIATFGTLGLLTGWRDTEGRADVIIAVFGLLLWVQALAVGDHQALRRFLGAIGLVMVAVLGPIVLIAAVTDPRPVPSLLASIGLGFILWCQAVAAQTGLGYRGMAPWLVVMIALTLGFGFLVLVTAAVGSIALGSAIDGEWGVIFRGVVLAVVGAFASGWAARHPGRIAVLRSLGRAALARATAEDSRLLAIGVRALVVPESVPPRPGA